MPSSILNTSKVELSIKDSILEKRGVHATVSCPNVVPQEKGRDFVCMAKVGKSKTPFVVEQTNEHGYVEYHAGK